MNGEELNIPQKQELRRARMTAIILGSAAVIVIISMIYGFTQSIEAQRQRIEASKQRDLAVTVEKIDRERVASLEEQLKICQADKSK